MRTSPLAALQPPNHDSKFVRELAGIVKELMASTGHPDENYCILKARSIGFGVPQIELIDAIGGLLYTIASSKEKIAEIAAEQVAKEFLRYGIKLPDGVSLADCKKPGLASRAFAFLRGIFRARRD